MVCAAGINGSRLVGRTVVRRQDFVITNKRDQRLQCSYWQVDGAGNATGRLPGVIYCHCNSGSRLDAVEAIWTLVPLGVRVFALDFSVRSDAEAVGCRLSFTYLQSQSVAVCVATGAFRAPVAHNTARVQGSGVSEGDYVTLGAGEVHDLECLVQVRRPAAFSAVYPASWSRCVPATAPHPSASAPPPCSSFATGGTRARWRCGGAAWAR